MAHPGKRLKAGVIGLGRMGSALVACLMGISVSLYVGAAMCRMSGVPLSVYRGDVGAYLGSEDFSRALESTMQMIETGKYSGGPETTLGSWAAALVKSIDECKALGVDTSVLASIRLLLDRAIAAGYEESDLTATFEMLVNKPR